MVGMLQILTYMMAAYMVLKGVEILQIGLASSRENRTGLILLGLLVLVVCFIMAVTFVDWQDRQAVSIRGQTDSSAGGLPDL